MKIDLIIDGKVYNAEPYLGQTECIDCALAKICDDFNTNPCKMYYSKVIFREKDHASLPDGLATPISNLSTSFRLQNLCKIAELATIGDILNVGKEGLLKYRGFGRKSLKELDELFAKYGFELKD